MAMGLSMSAHANSTERKGRLYNSKDQWNAPKNYESRLLRLHVGHSK